jgi:hypothetical protein
MSLTSIKQRNTKNNVLIDAKIDEINRLYQEGVSMTKIGQQLDIHRKALTRLFKNNHVESRRGFSYTRKYNLNEHYFDIIDTEEKAYILGFIYADGNNLFRTNRISIHLAKRDEEILKKMSHIFYGEEILKYNVRKNDKGETFHYVWLNLYSKHMSQHLATLGVVENKLYKIVFPEWLDKSMYRHFIRGLIDGDGWIYLPNNNRDSPNIGLICTRQVNDFLKNYFEEELGLKSYLVKAHKQDIDIMCEIRVKNYHQCKIFLDWLYKDATIHLQRKHNLYLNFLNRYENLREQNK